MARWLQTTSLRGSTWRCAMTISGSCAGFPALSASGNHGQEVTVFSCACHSASSLCHITPSLRFTEVSSQIATGERRPAGEVPRCCTFHKGREQSARDRLVATVSLLHEVIPTLPTYTALSAPPSEDFQSALYVAMVTRTSSPTEEFMMGKTCAAISLPP